MSNNYYNMIEELHKLNELSDDYITVEDFVYGGAIVIVDDARTFDTSIIEKELAKDHDDDLYEDFDEPTPRIIIDKIQLEELLQKITECNWFKLEKNKKNSYLKRRFNITNENIKELLKQLETSDYNYTLVSKNEKHNGALLHVFVTNKPFSFQGIVIEEMSLYIKLEFSDYGPICVVSLHPSNSTGKHPYAEDEE